MHWKYVVQKKEENMASGGRMRIKTNNAQEAMEQMLHMQWEEAEHNVHEHTQKWNEVVLSTEAIFPFICVAYLCLQTELATMISSLTAWNWNNKCQTCGKEKAGISSLRPHIETNTQMLTVEGCLAEKVLSLLLLVLINEKECCTCNERKEST